MKIEKRLILPLVLITILSTIFLASISGTAEAQTLAQLTFVPSDYTYFANFTSPPSFLAFNISVTNVTSLGTWQTTINWDPTVLSYKNTSIPSDNIFGSEQVISTSDNSTLGSLIYGSALLEPTHAVNGSGVLFHLELNVVNASLPGSDIIFAGIVSDTFLLDGSANDIPFGYANSKYANIYLTGTTVTHTISGSSDPVITGSNATIEPNSAGINTTSKTISFNVTGSSGDTAWMYAILPKSVIKINITDLSHWNVTVNSVQQSAPQITENTTHTFIYTTFPFASQVTLGVKGDWIIPELSSMLIILIIASSITVAVAKSRTRKK
jgi:hypothetical protein